MTDFESFLRRYEEMVYTTAIRLLGREAEAQDVSQEAFLKAFENFAMLERSESAGGWLKTVTTNLCLNHLTRHRARWTNFSELESEAPLQIAEPAPKDASDSGLEAALAALPDPQRVPLVLFHFEELSYEDIAAKLGVPLSKVKSDIFRGREALRRALGEEA